MQTEPGTLALVGNENGNKNRPICLIIADQTYPLSRDDIHTLLFSGQSVPLTRREEMLRTDGTTGSARCIDGYLTVHASGRAVIISTRTGYYQMPFACFQQVARGEAVSAPLFPTLPDCMGGGR